MCLLTTLLCFTHCKNDNKSSISKGSEPPSPGPGPGPSPDPTCSTEAGDFNGGDGTTADCPFLIHTYEQLKLISADLTAHYKLGSDIDIDAGAAGEDWTPIGDNSTDSAASRFTGSLDGDGYVISDLTVNIDATGTQYGGLFGYIGSGAEISKLRPGRR